jgi:hypothetical protein
MHKASLLPVLVIATLAVANASAQSSPAPDAEARRIEYQGGIDAISAKDWSRAEEIFKRLWLQHADYDVALSLGQVELHQGEHRAAAQHLAFGVRNYPPHEKIEALARAKQALAEAKKHVGTVHVLVDRSGANVLVDNAQAGVAPLSDELFVDPGQHSIEARSADLAPAQRTIQIDPGQEQTVTLTLTEGPPLSTPSTASPNSNAAPTAENPTAPTRTAAPSSVNWTPTVISAGAALVAIGIGTGFAFDVKSAKSDGATKLSSAEAEFGPNPCATPAGAASKDCSDLQKLQDRRGSSQTVATISFVAGGVFAASAVASYFIWARPATETQPAQLGGWLGPGSAGLNLQGTF